MEDKATRYIAGTQGRIGAVLILDLGYPDAKRAKVSLLVADGSLSRWVQRDESFYDEDLDDQPVGQVGLYVSDFLRGDDALPAALCRPSGAELAAGVSRNPQLVVTYAQLRSIFLRARELHVRGEIH